MAEVVRATLTGCLWWLLARLRLCLGGVDDVEVRRLLVRRLRLVVLLGGLAACCVLVAGTTAMESVAAPSLELSPIRTDVELAAYAAAVLPILPALAIWRYSQAIVRRALRDRMTTPEVCRAAARRVVVAGDGGWPLLLRRDDGRWFWLTGSPGALEPVRNRVARTRVRGFQVRVTLQYYRRSRVVKEIRGMAVEAVEAAWSPAAEPEPAQA